MQKDTKIKKVNPYQAARNRVKAVKNKLPINWRSIFFAQHKEYDNNEGQFFVNQVFYMRTADLRVTEILEKISTEYVAELTQDNKA